MTSTELVQREDDALAAPVIASAWNLAERVAQTEFVPQALRGKPEAVMAAILTGRELDIGPMQSLSKIHVIEGRPSMSSELMRAVVLSHGHELWIEEKSSTRVTVAGRRKGSEQTSKVTWTLDDAKQAGLNGRQNWRKYPRAMLTARATSELCRDVFADCLGGISYSIEEAQDGFDDAPIDASVPSGEPEPREPRRTVQRQSPQRQSPQRRQQSQPSGRPPLPHERQASTPAADDGEVIEAEVVEDGNGDQAAASEPRVPSPSEYHQQQRETAQAQEQGEDAPAREAADGLDEPTNEQLSHIHAIYGELGIDDSLKRAFYRARYGVSSTKDLSKEQLSRLIDYLKGGPPHDEEDPEDPGWQRWRAAKVERHVGKFREVAEAQIAEERAAMAGADSAGSGEAAEQEADGSDWRAEVKAEIGKWELHGHTVTAVAKRVAEQLGIDPPGKLADVWEVEDPRWPGALHGAIVEEGASREGGDAS